MASNWSLVVLLGFALMWAASSADPETGLSGAEGAGAEPAAAGHALLAERLEDRGIRAADPSPKGQQKTLTKKENCIRKCNNKCDPKENCEKKCNKKCNKKRKINRNQALEQENQIKCGAFKGKARRRCRMAKQAKKTKQVNRKKTVNRGNSINCRKPKTLAERKRCSRKAKKLRKAEKKETIDLGKTGRADTRASTINLTCLTTAIKLIKFMKDNVGNFLLRHSRQQKQNSLSTKKMNKKGQFAEPAARLVQAGGGNKSNLTCGGSTTSAGAKQLLNLTMRLDNCSAKLMEACAQPDMAAGGINQTFMTDCYKKSKGYNTTLMTCMASAIKGDDACSCFTDAKLVAAMTELKNCSGKAEAKMAAKVRTKCLAQMRSCNSDIEEAGRLQYTCKYTVADLKEMLAQISNNNDKVTEGQAKVKALTGVSAPVPGNSTTTTSPSREVRSPETEAGDRVKDLMATHGRHQGRAELTRSKRETYTCASLTTAVTACTTIVSMSPSSKGVLTACTITTTQTSITCTTTEKAALQATVNTLDTSARIFTAFIISLQNEIKDSSGAVVSVTELATLVSSLGSNAASTSTKAASSRNRNILRKMIMDKMKK